MNPEIVKYNLQLEPEYKLICEEVSCIIQSKLDDSESKIWHAHPVWFLEGNPIVGYSKQKAGIRLMFWSGADFDEEGLNIIGKKFKNASVFYVDVKEINTLDLKRWLQKSRNTL